ncbi:MAG: heavy metal translocating P-type ATPase [Deltaproteobacteria bacterium]|nr:heavy metal translocating P-type ATPase [Deltaproteobacteria bacterium]
MRKPSAHETKRARGPWLESFSVTAIIAWATLVGIGVHLALRYATHVGREAELLPLYVTLLVGGVPLLLDIGVKLVRRDLGADLLAGISIVAAVLLGEFLAAALVVLMLSGGVALERYAVARASSALEALARRMPQEAHRKEAQGVRKVALHEVDVGDELVVLPHEICPVDGEVLEGHGVMDESYLTGEPYQIGKAPGSTVLSGAINGEAALTIRATKRAVDSRYASIMKVMEASQQKRPRLRRLGDQIGALYVPIALGTALAAWLVSGDPLRFLAVLVVATPCPLLIGIPVAIIGAVSLSAKRGIVIRDPAVLEQLERCQTMILDKTGTLTHGKPELTEVVLTGATTREELLQRVASLEQYSKHPLASAVLRAAKEAKVELLEAGAYHERPGQGVQGLVGGRAVELTSRVMLVKRHPELEATLPPQLAGLEAMVVLDGVYAATLRFRDRPRGDSKSFIDHLGPKHRLHRLLIVSGDRRSEVEYLAAQVGIDHVFAEQSPEDKVAIVREEMAKAPTIFLGDGINDAPALTLATVGVAFGQHSDVTSEAAGAVIMDSSLQRVDEFFHVGRRLRQIALQSAVGGLLLSLVGMVFAAVGYLPPVAGALVQEAIDLLAIVNALRAALPPRQLHDY